MFTTISHLDLGSAQPSVFAYNPRNAANILASRATNLAGCQHCAEYLVGDVKKLGMIVPQTGDHRASYHEFIVHHVKIFLCS